MEVKRIRFEDFSDEFVTEARCQKKLASYGGIAA